MKILFSLFIFSFSAFSRNSLPQKVIICGICRDVASRLLYSIKIMEKIGSLFSDYRIIVYENNSADKTPDILRKWSRRNSKVFAITECIEKKELEAVIINRLDNHDFFRPEAIARARNIVLDRALSDAYKNFEYLIWMDMDFKRAPAYEGIIEIFQTNREWDAVFAYGIDPKHYFWDWYAFRDHQYPLGSELLGNDWWYLPKQLVLQKKDNWYPVYSAFGGCGIYKKKSIQGCRYSALVTEDLAKLSYNIIESAPSHPIVQKYLTSVKNLQDVVTIDNKSPYLPSIRDPNIGIRIASISENIIWKMSSFVYKYPSVCEHVPFHASMIVNGHDKLFINPRLLFRYGG